MEENVLLEEAGYYNVYRAGSKRIKEIRKK